MREILFRGKRIDTGEWIEGYYKKGTVIAGDRAAYIADIILAAPTKPFTDDFRVEVDPDTVGQYTGLTDMQDAKIFEGDIGQFGGEYGKIEYSEDEAMFQVVFEGWLTDFDHLRGTDVVVIGNIHDNPELLAEHGEKN